MINSDKVKFQYEFVDPCACNAWVATAVIGSAVIGAGATIYGANKAADTQKDAAKQAAELQQKQYAQTREDLSPYRAAGEDATTKLRSRLSELTTPISVKPQDFLESDYYKFLEKQGQKAVTNSSAARGLGSSGAALKGAAAFAKGLNSQEWQNNFNMQNINQTNAYSRLKALVDTGAGAATGTGVLGEKAAYNTGTALVGGANAQAAGYNATGNAISNAAGNIGGYAAYQGLYGNKSGGPITYGGPNGPTPFVA
jgi:hypothetical protein